ncbi:MAG: hypothetical protein O7H41_20960 [Planctomycetota bacterium]|nr:hypothetical protein [Planctomycetota bacterium]
MVAEKANGIIRMVLWSVFIICFAGCSTTGEGDSKESDGDSKQVEKKVQPERGRGRGRSRGRADSGDKSAKEKTKVPADDKTRKPSDKTAKKAGDKAKELVQGDDGGEEGTAAELIKVQSQLTDLQVELGDLQNFQSSVGKQLTDMQNSMEDLRAGIDSAEAGRSGLDDLIRRNQGLLDGLREGQASAKDKMEELGGQAARAYESTVDMEDDLASLKESVDSLSGGLTGLRRGRQQLEDAHALYLGKDEFNAWLAKFGEWKDEDGDATRFAEPQPKWWHLAVAFLVALIVSGVAFYLSIKAVKPAYRAISEIQAKVNVMASRSGPGEGGGSPGQ